MSRCHYQQINLTPSNSADDINDTTDLTFQRVHRKHLRHLVLSSAPHKHYRHRSLSRQFPSTRFRQMTHYEFIIYSILYFSIIRCDSIRVNVCSTMYKIPLGICQVSPFPYTVSCSHKTTCVAITTNGTKARTWTNATPIASFNDHRNGSRLHSAPFTRSSITRLSNYPIVVSPKNHDL